MAAPLSCFAACAPGLEPFLHAEIAALGLRGRAVGGGVGFNGSRRDLMRANLELRTASRVLVGLGTLHAAAFSELHRKGARLPWASFLAPGTPLRVRVTTRKSRLYHTEGIAERIARAASEALGRESPVEKPGQEDADEPEAPGATVIVTIDHDEARVSLDSSGSLLHRRGYRLATAKAPLRETLAAGLIFASGWDLASPLVDPFCGSGTIPIEAALMARRMAPGLARSFAFEAWTGHDAAAWEALRRGARDRVLPDAPPILGSDRDAGAIEAAQANAERAGVSRTVSFATRALSALEAPPGPGVVVTNPPRGGRISAGKDLRNLHAKLGAVLVERCADWRVAFLCAKVEDQTQVGLAVESVLRVAQGGQPLRLVLARAHRPARTEAST